MEQAYLYVVQLEALLYSASRFLEDNENAAAEALVALGEDVVQELKNEMFLKKSK